VISQRDAESAHKTGVYFGFSFQLCDFVRASGVWVFAFSRDFFALDFLRENFCWFRGIETARGGGGAPEQISADSFKIRM